MKTELRVGFENKQKSGLFYECYRILKEVNPSEMVLLEKYQIIINDMFTKVDQNYFAFCALITTDELREKCMKKFENKA